MPANGNFPGVYVQELPSSVHPITGVATSITAFVGRTLRGPTNVPTTINSFGDFQRTFGGLWTRSALGYAVQDFFMNGGGQAIIVRLYSPAATDHATTLTAAQSVAAAAAAAAAGATPQTVATAARTQAKTFTTDPAQTAANVVATAGETAAAANGATADSVNKAIAAAVNVAAPPTNTTLSVGGLSLVAASEGAWSKNLTATTDLNVLSGQTGAFNLTVAEVVNGQTVQKEVFSNLSVAQASPRRIDKVLAAGSQLVNWDSSHTLPAQVTAGTSTITATGSNGVVLSPDSFDPNGTGQADKKGLFALENTDLFNILCVPPYNDLVADGGSGDIDTATLLGKLADYCVKRRAMLMVDPPALWLTANEAVAGIPGIIQAIGSNPAANAAIFFPRLSEADPLQNNQIETFVPCGAVAGIFARTDSQRGVWKAPAGTLASIGGIVGQAVLLTNDENGELNPLGVNCLRTFPTTGTIVWGSRTLQGDDRLGSQWKYIPVRRTALYIEESLYRGLQWVVFEPNDEPLWAQIRLNVGAFMHDLFRKGAFQGQTPKDAYLVKCDSETTTQNDINNGIVNILVGFAPLKPAEFVILQIEQLAGQIQV